MSPVCWLTCFNASYKIRIILDWLKIVSCYSLMDSNRELVLCY